MKEKENISCARVSSKSKKTKIDQEGHPFGEKQKCTYFFVKATTTRAYYTRVSVIAPAVIVLPSAFENDVPSIGERKEKDMKSFIKISIGCLRGARYWAK